MHEEVSVVIPGAVNALQVDKNCLTSNLDGIDELMPKIKKIYEDYVKDDVHHRWN